MCDSECSCRRITGNPGTGKTTLARLVYEFFLAYNMLQKPVFSEHNGADLKGQYVGEVVCVGRFCLHCCRRSSFHSTDYDACVQVRRCPRFKRCLRKQWAAVYSLTKPMSSRKARAAIPTRKRLSAHCSLKYHLREKISRPYL